MTRRNRIFLVIAVVILFFAGGEAFDSHQFHSSDLGYRWVTGRDLPANTVAMDHASNRNDNPMHSTHYWLVQGPRENLLELAPGFRRSDRDATDRLHETELRMALGEPKMLEGYEGSVDGGRDRWLLILEPGDRALFVY